MKRLLIANRGEIACRVIRAARDLGMQTISVFSEKDRDALHVELADEAYFIGEAPASESYLNVEKIIQVAIESKVDAVHPGYGFLSENGEFAQQVVDNNLIWVGPSPETIVRMGNKKLARDIAEKIGVPVLPSIPIEDVKNKKKVKEKGIQIGFPLLIKAAGGGGGIGMTVVHEAEKLESQIDRTSELASRMFGDGTVYLEKYLQKARHIEIQIFGFGDGEVIHLFERDCSIQRRFQKIIEESPAPNIPQVVLDSMAKKACQLTASEKYAGAGTIEFILDVKTNEFFFLEMNTRIQVEHPVTEALTGIDLVKCQLLQAAGEEIKHKFEQREKNGTAIEVRIYAENPQKRFLPSPGVLNEFLIPKVSDTRVDTGYRSGDEVTPFYDPLLAKVIAKGNNRREAIDKLKDALGRSVIDGPANNIDFLLKILTSEDFANGDVYTGFIDDFLRNN